LKIDDSYEVMVLIRQYVETLGWKMENHDYKGKYEGDEEYTIWLKKIEE
jgi:hypothetical protein